MTELHYAQKTWKIVKISHAEKGEALDKIIRVEWAPSWISPRNFGPKINASDIASHVLIK